MKSIDCERDISLMKSTNTYGSDNYCVHLALCKYKLFMKIKLYYFFFNYSTTTLYNNDSFIDDYAFHVNNTKG